MTNQWSSGVATGEFALRSALQIILEKRCHTKSHKKPVKNDWLKDLIEPNWAYVL